MARLLPGLAVLFCLVAVARAEEEKVKEVVVEGVGTTEKEALQDAFRNAVRQVVGTFVSAETLVENDRLIKDKVLAASDGFVKTYKLIGKPRKEGPLLRMTVRAAVMRERLYARLKKFKVTDREVPDDVKKDEGRLPDDVPEKMTKEEARRKKVKVLRDVLVDYPRVLYAQAQEPDSDDYDRDKGVLTVNVDVLPDMKAYQQWRKRLEALLGKISEPTQTAQPAARITDVNLTLPKTSVRGLSMAPGKEMVKLGGPDLSKLPDAWYLWLMTSSTDKHARTSWTGYVVDANPARVLQGLSGELAVKLELLDREGDRVAGEEFSIEERSHGWLGRLVMRRRSDGYFNRGTSLLQSAQMAKTHPMTTSYTYNLYLAPYLCLEFTGFWNRVKGGPAYVPLRTYQRKMTLTADEWKKVKKVRCTIVFKPGKVKE